MQAKFQFAHRGIIGDAFKIVVTASMAAVVIHLLIIIGNAAVERVQPQPQQYNPYLDPVLYSALEIELHKADPDYNNPHYYGRVVPLGNAITVQMINDEGERELIEVTYDYLRNGSRG